MKKRKYTNEQLKIAVKNNVSVAGVLRDIGLSDQGGSTVDIRELIKKLNFDTSHFTGALWNRGRILPDGKHGKKLLSDILVNGSTFSTSTLRKRLIEANVLKNECVECGIRDTYNRKSITLHLDHINGIDTDHRIENLRILCPNCHSQTETYCGKNITKIRERKEQQLILEIQKM